MIRVALVPLDDRPACRRLPAMVAAVAQGRVLTPRAGLLPAGRRPGDPDELGRWLAAVTPDADAVVVSLETLGLGGLVASRTRYESVATAVRRWDDVLSALDRPVHAACVVQRTPDVDDAAEEPEYWQSHGRALHAYSAALCPGASPQDDHVAARREAVPAAYRRDYLLRRQRNHALNQAALSMAATGVLRTLVIGADDADRNTLGAAEWRWLRSWAGWLECGDRVLAHPGADETGAVLTARALADAAGIRPRVAVACAEPDGLRRTAGYEPAPVGEGVAGQVAAVGADVVPVGDADVVLVVHAPQRTGADWAVAPPPDTDPDAATATADLVTRLLIDGRRVAVADCGLPNGADPRLVTALLAGGGFRSLLGFAGWNTAGNTIGGVLAHAVAYLAGRAAGTFDAAAHHRLLAHRLVEDHCYMSWARPRIRAERGTDPTRHDTVEADSGVPLRIESLLRRRLDELSFDWRVVPGTVSLPWCRTYEIDLDVEPA